MCRLLLVENPDGVDPNRHLDALRELASRSVEYQGHGWGCAWLSRSGRWNLYHNISPVWEDRRSFDRTTVFIAHARSAFRDEGICVENNMPFCDGNAVFAFNGELQGVRLKSVGRIGAEKIFNTVRRMYRGNYAQATRRAVMVLNRRTRYIRAMNFFLASPAEIQVCSQFGENPDYFQMRETRLGETRIICSESYPLEGAFWKRVPNHKTYTLNLGRVPT